MSNQLTIRSVALTDFPNGSLYGRATTSFTGGPRFRLRLRKEPGRVSLTPMNRFMRWLLRRVDNFSA
jgi:hypothetical protein